MTNGMTGALYRPPDLASPAQLARRPVELDADDLASSKPRRTPSPWPNGAPPRLVVGAEEACHQPWLDPVAVADDRGGGAIGTASTTLVQMRRCAWATGEPAVASKQLGVDAAGARPASLVVMPILDVV
jgi:hypothetical protein